MAPDFNSFPPSPHDPRQTPSRRYADLMAPPAPPNPSSGTILQQSLGREPGTMAPSGFDNGPGMSIVKSHREGPKLTDGFAGPLRHPRPLTAADLHMQLEKEQEAVVSSYMKTSVCSKSEDSLMVVTKGQQAYTRALTSTPADCLGRFNCIIHIYWPNRLYGPQRQPLDLWPQPSHPFTSS